MHCYALLCMYLFIYETDVQNSILNNFYTFINHYFWNTAAYCSTIAKLSLQGPADAYRKIVFSKPYQTFISNGSLGRLVSPPGTPNNHSKNGCFSWMSPIHYHGKMVGEITSSLHPFCKLVLSSSRAGKNPSSNSPPLKLQFRRLREVIARCHAAGAFVLCDEVMCGLGSEVGFFHGGHLDACGKYSSPKPQSAYFFLYITYIICKTGLQSIWLGSFPSFPTILTNPLT